MDPAPNSEFEDKHPKWKAFEKAVAAFLQALDPAARVKDDVRIPDIDTGLPRQRDVWIETSFGGHIPITILVSCKREKSKLSQQDLDAFAGELRSSGANKGVIYSFSGFSQPALSKAERLSIACCTLYEDRPPDIPDVLAFNALCYRECSRLHVLGDEIKSSEFIGAVLDAEIEMSGETKRVSRILVEKYEAARPKIPADVAPLVPPVWSADLSLKAGDSASPFTLRLESYWRVYQAKLDAWLLNGSYSYQNQSFSGSFSMPWVDRLGGHPGQGWEEIENPEIDDNTNVISCILSGGNTEEALRMAYGLQEERLEGKENDSSP